MDELELECHLLATLVTSLDPSISYRQAGAAIFDKLYYIDEEGADEETMAELGKELRELRNTALGYDEQIH